MTHKPPPEPGSPEAFQQAHQEKQRVVSQAEISQATKVIQEIDQRKRESLRCYDPTPFQDRYHQCNAKECLMTAGNQVGKSMAGFVELARALTGQDPHDKYRKTNGIAVVVGWDEGHISRVVYPYLFSPGYFQIYYDEATGSWKSWKPWDPAVPEKDTIEAPALIPDRFIKSIAWRKRATDIFSRIEFTTGWILHAFTSRGEPPGGFKADLIHIDEDLQRPHWYREAAARTTMRNGRLRWTALPHARNNQLINVIERAADEEDENIAQADRQTVHIHATVFDNPYMSKEAREANIKIWKAEGDDVYRQRALGELVTDSVMVYPSFSKTLHSAMEPVQEKRTSEARKIYMGCNGVPPENWMRTMIVDPGHTMCAVLFVATPPPKLGNERFVFGELALQNCNAIEFARRVEKFMRITGQHGFQRFIIDAHGGALTSMETGISPRRAYTRELETQGIRCIETDSAFRSGSDDIAGRETALRGWMLVSGSTGEPTILVDMGRCPRLVRTLPRFRKKEIEGIVQEAANRRLECHHIECLEYAAADGLNYISPPTGERKTSRAERLMAEMKQRKKRKSAKGRSPGATARIISLGPAS